MCVRVRAFSMSSGLQLFCEPASCCAVVVFLLAEFSLHVRCACALCVCVCVVWQCVRVCVPGLPSLQDVSAAFGDVSAGINEEGFVTDVVLSAEHLHNEMEQVALALLDDFAL